jgi:hypothetical protein
LGLAVSKKTPIFQSTIHIKAVMGFRQQLIKIKLVDLTMTDLSSMPSMEDLDLVLQKI